MKSICTIAILALLVTIPLSLWSAENGAATYKEKCAGCHGDKGEGNAAVKFPAVKGIAKTEAQIVEFLMKGETGKTIHAAPTSGVSEEQAKALATFIKSLK
jgi:mono/diheme cytochrome c family protein